MSFSSLQGRVPIGVWVFYILYAFRFLLYNCNKSNSRASHPPTLPIHIGIIIVILRRRYVYIIYIYVHSVHCIYMINIAQNKKKIVLLENDCLNRDECVWCISNIYIICIFRNIWTSNLKYIHTNIYYIICISIYYVCCIFDNSFWN